MLNEFDFINDDESETDIVTRLVCQISRSQLFTIIVEGREDAIIYRQLEDELQNDNGSADIIVANGRNIALKIFSAIKTSHLIGRVSFVVDKDCWVYSVIPQEYIHFNIVFTKGYSIENDIYLDRNINNLLLKLRLYNNFIDNIKKYTKWYALAIDRVMNDSASDDDSLNMHPNQFFNHFRDDYVSARPSEIYPESLYTDIVNDFTLKLRGKNLLNLAIWTLNSRKKDTNMKSEYTAIKHEYNYNVIIEETVLSLKGENINRIFTDIRNIYDKYVMNNS